MNYLSHLWTLAIEEQFYFIWPLVIYFSSNIERLRRGLLWAFLSVSLLRYILHASGIIFDLLYINTFTHCDALILGGYLALSIRSTASDASKFLHPNRFVVVLLLVIAMFVLNDIGFSFAWEAIPTVMLLRNMIKLPLCAILFVWLIQAAILQKPGRIYFLFFHPILRWVGKYSYALYVLHIPLAFLILRSNIPWLSSRPIPAQLELFVLYFGSSIAAAFLSWHLYEKHFL